MDRYLRSYILKDSLKKISLISGPRQCGKTTLAKNLFESIAYLNYDLAEDRLNISKAYWPRNTDCIIFDELHKMPDWKRFIKGIYDTEGNNPRLIVTGSANMETFTKVGDSLAGRYFHYRLHPLDLKEATHLWNEDKKLVFNHLMNFGGFPEPFLTGETRFYRRWQKTHLDVILKQDFLDLYAVRSIKSIELLMHLLKSRVASQISYQNLANDLQVDSKTVKSWIGMLENFYLIFKITPYHRNIARSLLKEPKVYFFDCARVEGEGEKLENLVACALLKEIHFLEDTEGVTGSLHYLKTKDGDELDFLIVVDGVPVVCFEVKTSDDTPSKQFRLFKKQLDIKHCVQLVLNLKREFDTADGIAIRDLISFLSNFNLQDYLHLGKF